ncbi:MAG: M16 family metallopeptidase [Endomicrobiia bacterium]
MSVSYLFSYQKKEILNNGIILIHNHNSEQPIVAITIFLKMGSIYEPHNLGGISSLLQSVIIKGTKNRTAQQIAEEIETLGGSISADSDYDYSTLSVAVGSKYFDRAVEIMADIFLNPVFEKNEIEKEKFNLIASIISRRDNIFNVAIDELLYNLYGKKHPYRQIPEGNVKTLKKIHRKQLIDWWQKFYGVENNNIVIVVSGDIDFETSKTIIMKHFEKIPKVKLPKIEYENIKIKHKYVKKKTHFKQGYLMYGYKAPNLSKEKIKNFLYLKLLSLYLGGGMSGKLFEILREQNSLGYETNCFYPTRFLDSHFVIYIGLDYDRVNIGKEKINEIVEKLKLGELFSEEDLKEVKSKFRGRYLLDHQTNLRQSWYLGFWEIMNFGYEYDKKYLEEIENINLEDIRKVASEIFNKEFVLVELIPKK